VISTTESSTPEHSAPTGHILVVEDDSDSSEMLESWLEEQGHTVCLAANAAEALVLLELERPDLVLLDLVLPDVSGFTVLERIRRKHPVNSLPVIMLTAQEDSDDIIQGFRLGASDYAKKPVDLELLSSRIKRQLQLKAGSNRQIANFRIDRKLGAGGMGVVYAATHMVTGDRVALKVLHRSMAFDHDYVARFMRETELASRVKHENVVAVIDAGCWEETYYLAMELIEGDDVFDLVSEGRLSLKETLDIAVQVTRGIAAIHDEGILHRDIKPENVLLDRQWIAKISDFGIARELTGNSRLTDPGVGFGTVAYTSPEQMLGEGDQRSDFYSLGATIFFMVTGKDPFPADKPPTLIYSLKNSRVPRMSEYNKKLQPALVELVAGMMQPQEHRRISDHRRVISVLERVRDALPED